MRCSNDGTESKPSKTRPQPGHVYSLDRTFEATTREFRETGDGKLLWEADFAGIEREYCQIVKLANLDQIPRVFGFKVCSACRSRYRTGVAAGAGPSPSSEDRGPQNPLRC